MPACHETVTWLILNKPIYITKQQVLCDIQQPLYSRHAWNCHRRLLSHTQWSFHALLGARILLFVWRATRGSANTPLRQIGKGETVVTGEKKTTHLWWLNVYKWSFFMRIRFFLIKSAYVKLLFCRLINRISTVFNEAWIVRETRIIAENCCVLQLFSLKFEKYLDIAVCFGTGFWWPIMKIYLHRSCTALALWCTRSQHNTIKKNYNPPPKATKANSRLSKPFLF